MPPGAVGSAQCRGDGAATDRRTTTVRTPPAAALDTTVSDGGSRSPLAWLARRRSVTAP